MAASWARTIVSGRCSLANYDQGRAILAGVALQVNVYEAKAQLSRLLDRVAAGEEIVIARSGRPVARLVPLGQRTSRRQPGGWRGRVRIAPDFDELPAETAAAFRGASPGVE